jgi:hypothetical protein
MIRLNRQCASDRAPVSPYGMDTFDPSGQAQSFDNASPRGGIMVARDDFQLAAKRAEAAHTAAEWLSLGQRGRSAAIYKELRKIDHEAAKHLAAKVVTARWSVREGEVRQTRHEAIVSAFDTHNHSHAAATGQDMLDTVQDARSSEAGICGRWVPSRSPVWQSAVFTDPSRDHDGGPFDRAVVTESVRCEVDGSVGPVRSRSSASTNPATNR